MGRVKRRLARLALFVAFLFVTAEVSARILLLISPKMGLLSISPSTFFREQSEDIERILTGRYRGLVRFDGELGWVHVPDTKLESEGRGIGPWGTRGPRNYLKKPSSGILRAAIFGDSFAYGMEVPDGDDWCAQLEELDPSIEAMNFGVPGYGPDQALLRAERDLPGTHAHVAILVVSVWDLPRLLSRYGKFRTPDDGFSTKPRFVRRGEKLELLPNPVSSREDLERLVENPESILELFSDDPYYFPLSFSVPFADSLAISRVSVGVPLLLYRKRLDPNRPLRWKQGAQVFNSKSESYDLLHGVIDRFVALAKERDIRPKVLFLPGMFDLLGVRNGSPSKAGAFVAEVRQRGAEVDYILQPFLAHEELEPLFAPGGHYSKKGNAVVAKWLFDSRRTLLAKTSVDAAAHPSGWPSMK